MPSSGACMTRPDVTRSGPGALRRDFVTNGPPAHYGAIGERVRLRAGAACAAIYLPTWCKLYSGKNYGRDVKACLI